MITQMFSSTFKVSRLVKKMYDNTILDANANVIIATKLHNQ